MYQLGVSEGTQSKRVEKYLETKYMNLDYEKRNDGDGFIMFMFPSLDEEEFSSNMYIEPIKYTNGRFYPSNTSDEQWGDN